MSRKKKRNPGIDPAYLEKQKAALVRTHRHIICFNEKEMAAVEEYCRRFNVKTKASLFREAIMERILSALDENHPTLF